MNLERIKLVQETRKKKMLCKICNKIISRGHMKLHDATKMHINFKNKSL